MEDSDKLIINEAEAIECLKRNKPTIGYVMLQESIDMAIQAIEKQIPKKPYKDNENGIYEKEYCPICHRSLFPNDHHCICGQAIDWRDEEWVI